MHTYRLKIHTFLGLLAFFTSLNSQSDNGQIQRNHLQSKLQQTESILKKTSADKDQAWRNIQMLEKQMDDRAKLLSGISAEMELLESELKKLRSDHSLNLQKLDVLKNQYYSGLRQQWFQSQTIHSSAVFSGSDALKPIMLKQIWTKQLNQKRKNQYETFRITQDEVLLKQQEILKRIEVQKNLLQTKDLESSKLQHDLAEQKRILAMSESQQKSYTAQIRKYESEMKNLEKYISGSISSDTKNAKINSTESKTTSKWNHPLKDGVIVTRFGKQKDPNNKHLNVRNNGVDILSQNAFVSSSLDAEVVQIKEMPNGSYLVMTKKSNQYLVYSNLEQVLVKPGEKIQTGNHIGKARKNSQGNHELHFEIWNGKQPVDPTNYIGD